jgi:hypothetical protein
MKLLLHSQLIVGNALRDPNKVEEPIPDTLRLKTTKESELDMKKI